MASLEAFESTLKEVVQAKKLSASKMATLTDYALKSMENDTELVLILYRTHKKLKNRTAKVSSLYVFDALSRAARNQVNKRGLTADGGSTQGNCATFLLKVEGILDGLFGDMVSSGNTELKEKTKKILDIWVKSNTFPSDVLSRLSKLLKGAEKEPDKVTTATTADPRSQSIPSSTTSPPAPVTQPTTAAGVDVQTTLLALLNQAANAVGVTNGQTTPNTATPALDPNQLALLKQLTQTVQGNAVATQPISVPVSLETSSTAVPVVPPVGGPSQPLPYRDDHYGPAHRESNHDRFDVSEHGNHRDDIYDDHRDHKGGFRGRGRGRWDNRDSYRDRSGNRDWNPPFRGRRSRSRSPSSRYGGRRDIKTYSPPRRPAVPSFSPPDAPDTGKDEFGRDLRAASPKGSDTSTSSHVAARSSLPPVTILDRGPVASGRPNSLIQEPSSSAIAAEPSFDSPSTSVATSQQGLDAFDRTSFDPSSPASWEALGKAWAVTYGCTPSQSDLIQFMMQGPHMGLPVASQFTTQQGGQWYDQSQGWNYSQQSQPNRGAWRGGFNDRGRGGGHGSYGNSRNAGYTGGRGFEQQDTDAITLAGEDPGDEDTSSASWQISADTQLRNGQSEVRHPESSVGGQGRMQKVGEKWVFVRASEAA